MWVKRVVRSEPEGRLEASLNRGCEVISCTLFTISECLDSFVEPPRVLEGVVGSVEAISTSSMKSSSNSSSNSSTDCLDCFLSTMYVDWTRSVLHQRCLRESRNLQGCEGVKAVERERVAQGTSRGLV